MAAVASPGGQAAKMAGSTGQAMTASGSPAGQAITLAGSTLGRALGLMNNGNLVESFVPIRRHGRRTSDRQLAPRRLPILNQRIYTGKWRVVWLMEGRTV
ncbi:hypothetical protein SETIT_7G196900v2 [Setaria italica]|uniref:Uncharacterized protein n=1 Tax=Setaria italica TaxID=4555 RepID=A0A368RXL7_SETIT|nr:hypothetical protein SETIT_7G196900v2 [Setaria italica]